MAMNCYFYSIELIHVDLDCELFRFRRVVDDDDDANETSYRGGALIEREDGGANAAVVEASSAMQASATMRCWAIIAIVA
mmetsp:Transcript_19544/g.41221  ORF Transcript_19544/g.41221 Transcript_19544/m.41221 type:complete len:80 (-) Transcript_19544:41-280(-)